MLRLSRTNSRPPARYAPCVVLAVLGSASAASGDDFSVKLKPSVAIPLNAPQRDLYDIGGGGMLKAMFGLRTGGLNRPGFDAWR